MAKKAGRPPVLDTPEGRQQFIVHLKEANGIKAHACRRMGIDKSTFRKVFNKSGIEYEQFREDVMDCIAVVKSKYKSTGEYYRMEIIMDWLEHYYGLDVSQWKKEDHFNFERYCNLHSKITEQSDAIQSAQTQFSINVIPLEHKVKYDNEGNRIEHTN